MKEFIVEEARKIFYKCLTALESKEENPSLLLRKNENGMRYSVAENFVPKRDISFKDILGVKIDLKGYSLIVPPKMENIIEGFEKEYGTKDIAVGIYKNAEDEGEIRLFVFADGNPKREFHLEEVIQI